MTVSLTFLRVSCLAVAMVSVLGRSIAQDPAIPGPTGTVPSQWRLVWTESPQTRATMAWSTAREGERHRVYYDTESRGGVLDRYRWQVECQANGEYAIDEPELYYHHAALTGLSPSTTYYLVMASDDDVSREFSFVTAPDDDRPFAILHGGDSRSDRGMRRRMNQRIAQLAGADDGILALAHGGDYVVSGVLLTQWSPWMTDHELTVTEKGRLLPIIPTRGNHESLGPLFDEVFASPGGGLGVNFYATELSPQVLLVTLNTEIAAGGRQKRFLSDCLEANAGCRWKLVQYHRPIWPAVKLPSRGKTHWQPLFDKHDVDLVCEADGHALKRTVPIRGDAAHPEGVVYIGEGGLGVPQRTPNRHWFLKPPGFTASAHHVWLLRFSRDELRLEAVTVDGLIADRAVLKPRVRAR